MVQRAGRRRAGSWEVDGDVVSASNEGGRSWGKGFCPAVAILTYEGLFRGAEVLSQRRNGKGPMR